MTPRRSIGLLRDARGATAIEFAIVAPVMMLMLVGGFDLGHTLYMSSVLEGVVQKAARDGGLEGSTVAEKQEAIDTKVKSAVHDLSFDAAIDISRRYYKTFSKAAEATAETYTDNNHNGVCDNNEPFIDTNNNNTLDDDGGDAGQGGAKDLVLYTVKVSYPRIMPLSTMVPGVPPVVNLTATTLLGNQPYGEQSQYAAAGEGHCNP
jgi:Flp pilus assembly protein TadG